MHSRQKILYCSTRHTCVKHVVHGFITSSLTKVTVSGCAPPYADAVLGPFPNIREWADLYAKQSGFSVSPSPMSHELMLQMPYLDYDPHVRDDDLDTENKYEFFFASNGEMNKQRFASLISKNWTTSDQGCTMKSTSTTTAPTT